MNKKAMYSLLAAALVIPTAAYAATTFRADLELISCNGSSLCKINKRTVNGQPQSDHIVPASIGKTVGSLEASLDPRAESFFSRRITRDFGKTVTFEADYNVVTATRTTIMQTLLVNDNAQGSDRFFPGVFVTATRTTNSAGRTIVKLYAENPEREFANLQPFLTLTGTTVFTLRVQSNGNSATVFVNGTRQYSQSFSNNTHVTFRYGAYHHSAGDSDNTGANIRVTNARLVIP